ncbi:hypothetical protein GCM10014719_29740 [Planomonospora parontospora subsp. antibiotica]|nr:hypothetical protein GCM10014719_29740 [Planomonospora parontospora subsp. antibiotica]GII16074.1 hypothetical protein Ppa05_28000 [Planomonospora parontospora subsp. antibiotica]
MVATASAHVPVPRTQESPARSLALWRRSLEWPRGRRRFGPGRRAEASVDVMASNGIPPRPCPTNPAGDDLRPSAARATCGETAGSGAGGTLRPRPRRGASRGGASRGGASRGRDGPGGTMEA